ncbi:ubiquitin carboxyl-terminal hydrolase [Vairimorpha necatrix]|uniref:Ubiquitin carboxyl-terminal hydrolase n=1 Tax=Vairimorpha necatrix TaxID=6039 RepID=A0AAX4JB25_9MICR
MVIRDKRIYLQPKGIKNARNNCFFNSSIQCILSSGDLIEFYKNSQFDASKPVSRAFSLFIDEYEKSNTLSPEKFLNFLNNKIDIFNGLHQDAHEFLIRFLDALHEELPNQYKMCKNISEFKDHCAENFIANLFHSFLKQTVLCPNCKNKSETFVSTNMIQGEVQKNTQDILSGFFESENVDGGKLWKCEKCSYSDYAVKSYEVIAYPKILILFIKRYNSRFSKTQDDIEVDEQIKFCNNIYFLNGIVCHIGDLSGGHYFSSSKRNGKWINFNDSSVSSGRCQYSGNQPCIIFYTKNK